MKFVIPQNYNFKNKLFGIIYYSNLIFILIWSILIFSIINLIFQNLDIKIFLFISFVFPIALINIVGINGESFIDILIYIVRYIFSTKLYLYKKY